MSALPAPPASSASSASSAHETALHRFRNPDPWHAPAAYWFWHRLPDGDTIRDQVRQMHDAGIRSFQVQARLSYPIEGYLDDDYLAACRTAVETAAGLGMIVGIYDDYNWQTGHAAGRAVTGHDELRERHLFWVRIPAGAGEGSLSGIRSATENLGPAAMDWHYEGGVVAWADWRVEYAVVVEAVGAAQTVDVEAVEGGQGTAAERPELVDRVDGAAEGCRVRLAEPVPDGAEAIVFVSARCATSRLVNPVDPVAVDRFIEAGYQPFADALGDFFGSTVAYMFFDQPHAVYYDWAERTGDLRSAMPFHESLAVSIRERWGGRTPQVLAAVLDGDDPERLSLRAQFYEHFSGYAMETFLGKLRAWSHAHGLRQSGHEVLGHVGGWALDTAFANWDLRVNFGLDHFGVDGYRDLTAVDAQDALVQLSPVFGDSVARHHGRGGTMVEQYFVTPPEGGTPWSGHWGLTLQELRTTAINHHLQGMRQMIFHGFYQTHGHGDDHDSLRNPRFDFPPGINFEPWFAEHHPRFALESARLSEFLEPVSPQSDVAVLYPLRTVWTAGQLGEQASAVGDWARALTESRVGFHLVDERDLDAATVAEGAVWFGDRRYRALVLPAVTTLRSAGSLRRLRRLTESGVRVLAGGATPTVYQEGPQTAAEDWADLAPAVEMFHAVPEEAVLRGLAARRGRTEPTLRVPAGSPVRWRGGPDTAGGFRFACFTEAEGTVELLLPDGPWHIEEWEAADGTVRTLGAAGNPVALRLEQNALRLLRVRRDAGPASGRADATEDSGAAAGHGTPEWSAPEWSAPAALESGWRLEVAEDSYEEAGARRDIAVTCGWERQGLPAFAGTADYVRQIDLDTPVPLELTLPDVAGAVAVSVNGLRVAERAWAPYRVTIPADTLRPGGNELRVRVAPSAANRYYSGTGLRAEPEPCGLLAPPLLRHALQTPNPGASPDGSGSGTRSSSITER
ncbi:hypothetical protein [Streptomyces rapamycinicus]|uniref:Glycoside hydrolase n=2 Tax=Streptomyces rapamycinicus TaxID=1226757 RepID=A0A3L8RBR0_STRRN|nr:hypothetical protein [Streptomyces rapamycinicus]MBB4789196.1 hypothetical protein [Streptomyces rapamycinicus]RLV77165.1 hypothetical protein D3C57_102310 [Streptomyces rapamycinicus NRRL 5491]UTO67347.1 hypothetical protein LJB45_36940 [Streptomyces rapamycinicus]UTP35304.1 hypothetical protein LIV37_42075 [Streptomyces rapamycinicus NRRL 5491]